MSGAVFKEKCAITGEPARYRDPVTGLPYANLAAFKILRERYQNESGATARPEESNTQAPAKTPSEPAGKPNTHQHTTAGDRGSAAAHTDGAEEDGDIVSAERLADLAGSAPLKRLLEHPDVAKKLRRIMTDSNRHSALSEARKDPKVEEAVLCMLETIGYIRDKPT